MIQMPNLRVVSAEIQRDGRWLIVQRPANAVLPLLWEFPGGRVRPGETDAEALVRGVKLRIGAEVEVGPKLMEVHHDYEGYTVTLVVYRAELGDQEPIDAKVAAHAWVTPDEMSEYPFPGADQHTVDALLGVSE